jgi:hypothetical protein
MKPDGSGDGVKLLREYLGHASLNTTTRYNLVVKYSGRMMYTEVYILAQYDILTVIYSANIIKCSQRWTNNYAKE